MRRALPFLLLAALAVPAARAQLCTDGVCVVNYQAADQTTFFEMRNLREEAVAVTLWFEYLSGMEALAPVPLTEVLQPGERREVLTLKRLNPGVPGNYRFRFDWRPEPVTACPSPLACTWWERTAEATTLRVVRKVDFPVALHLIQPNTTDTLRVVLWSPGRADVLRLAANTVRPNLRIALLPVGPEAEARFDSARVHPLPYRGRLRVRQTPDAVPPLPADLPPRAPDGVRPFSWEAPPGTRAFTVRAGVVVGVSAPRAQPLPPDTFRTGNRMVITRTAPGGHTVTVLHPDGTNAFYSGLATVAPGVAPGERIEAGVFMGVTAPGNSLILGLQRSVEGRSEAIVPRFRTAQGVQRLVPGALYAAPD